VDPPEGFEAMVLERGDWPDTLIAGQSGSLDAGLFLEGSPVDDAPIRWRSDDTTVVWLDPSVAGDSVAFRARRNGGTDVMAYVEGPPPYPDTTARATVTVLLDGVRFMTADTTLTALGDTVFVWACGLGIDGWQVFNTGVDWELSNAVVSGESMRDTLLAVAATQGADTITVTHDACADACADTLVVTVDQVPADVRAAVDTLPMSSLGEEAALWGAVRDRRGHAITDEPITWSLIAGGDVAGLSDAGVVTSLANGEARVEARAGEAADTVTVLVEQVPAAVTLSPAIDTVASGDTLTLSADVRDANGNTAGDVAVAWTAIDSSIASVDDAGRVVGALVGTVDVVATAGEAADTAAVTVVPGTVAALASTPDSVELTWLGQTTRVDVGAADGAGNTVADPDLTWTVADTGVATVDSTGQLMARANGATSMTVEAGTGFASVKVVVRQVVDSVQVTAAQDTVASGSSTQLTATAYDAGGSPVADATVSWQSADESVATVDGSGTVTGALVGTVDITASAEGHSRAVAVTVIPGPVATLGLGTDSLHFTWLGETASPGVTAHDAAGNTIPDPSPGWACLDTLVAAVAGGVVTARGNGLTRLIAEAGGVADTVPVAVAQVVTDVVLDVDTVRLASGDSTVLTARAVDAGGSTVGGVPLAWSVGDSAVARVDSAGRLLGDRADTTRVVVATDGVADTAFVQVSAGTVAALDASPDSSALAAFDATVQLSATGTDAAGNDVTDPNPIWTSLDTLVATVDGSGLVTAVGNGTARMVGTAGDGADTVVVTVWQTVASATLARDTVGFGTLADEDTVTVTFRDPNDSVVVRTVSPVWSSSDSAVATVAAVATDSARGRVASVHFGEARVMVWAEGVSDSAWIRVVPDRIEVTAAADTLNAIGDTVAFTAVAYDTANTAFAGEAVAWEALDTTVLQLLTGDTLADARGTGTGRVAAGLMGVADTASVVVRQVVAAIALSPSPGEVALGDTLHLAATATDSNGVVIPGYAAAWSTSDSSVATVDSTGVATGHALGTATITASGNGVAGTSDVTVDVYTAETCTDPGATQHSTDITTSETWSLAASPHRVTQSLSVQDGALVTVEAGAVVCFDGAVKIYFTGGRLAASGTAAEPVAFIATEAGSSWGGLRFGGTPADTSRLTNVRLVDAHSPAGAIETAESHPVVLDSVRVRQARYLGVQLASPGSRMVRSTIDTTAEASQPAAMVGSTARIESSTIRGAAGDGVRTVGTGTGEGAVLQDVTVIDAGGRGVSIQSDSARLIDVRIDGSAGIGLDAPAAYPLTEATGVRVLNGESYGAQLSLHNLYMVAPTVADQDSLLGNAKDTLLVDGGTITGTVDFDGNPVTTEEVEAGPSLPWRVVGDPTVGAAGILTIEPGSRLVFDSGRRITFDSGRLIAQGTADSTIVFTSTAPGTRWDYLDFRGDPKDTSHVAHAVVEWANDNTYYGAIYSRDQHPVAVENTVIRQAQGRAAYFRGAGSRLIASRVDTVAGTRPAVVLGAGTRLATTTIREVDGPGIRVTGKGVVIDTVEVLTTGAEGVWVQGDSASIHGLRVDGAGGTGIEATGSYPLAEASGVRVLNGASYGAELGIDNLLTLAPTPADQDSLLGNAKDTLVINGGSIKGTVDFDGNPVTLEELTVRSDIPWRVDGGFTLDSATVLHIQPGSYLAMGPGQSMTFQSGQLSALGTADSTIVFTTWDPNGWGGLWLFGIPPDTSRLRHVKLEWARGGNGETNSSYNYTVAASATHPMTLDTVHIRRSWQHAVDLLAPGSRLAEVTVDTTGSSSYPAVILGDSVTATNLTVRAGAGDGLWVRGDSTLLQGVRVENAGGVGLRADGGASMRRGGSVRVVDAGSYGARLGVENLYAIAPTAADQDSLLGNAKDTLIIEGGTLRGTVDGAGTFVSLAEVTARADLPWKVDQSFTIDSAGVLTVQPGASLAFAANRTASFTSGRLSAAGTADSTIVFTSQSPPDYWYGLSFRGDPQDTSVVRHARFEWSKGSNSTFSSYAEYVLTAGDQHPLVVDSTRLRRILNQAVELASRGSRLTGSTVDTTQDAGYAAVRLGGAEIARSVIRNPAGVGIEIGGDSVRLTDVRIEGAGGVGLVATGFDVLDSDGVRITGGASYPVSVGVAQLARLAGTPAQQDSLRGNAKDTVHITGGTLTGDTVTLGPGIAWWADRNIYVDSAGLAVLKPGARMEFTGARMLQLTGGGRLEALGTADSTIVFTARDSTDRWTGLVFDGTAADTSRLKHAEVAWAGRTYDYDNTAVQVESSHVLYVDSTLARDVVGEGIRAESAAGLHLTDVTVRNPSAEGVWLEAGTIDGLRVEGAGSYGLYVGDGTGVGAIDRVRVTGGASYPLRTNIQHLTEFADLAWQDSLRGNAKDTVHITGGTLTGDTVTLGPAIAWWTDAHTYVDSAGLVEARGTLGGWRVRRDLAPERRAAGGGGHSR
jgi:uncharacterized protein YjdB